MGYLELSLINVAVQTHLPFQLTSVLPQLETATLLFCTCAVPPTYAKDDPATLAWIARR